VRGHHLLATEQEKYRAIGLVAVVANDAPYLAVLVLSLLRRFRGFITDVVTIGHDRVKCCALGDAQRRQSALRCWRPLGRTFGMRVESGELVRICTEFFPVGWSNSVVALC